jgi:hypothetical protein
LKGQLKKTLVGKYLGVEKKQPNYSTNNELMNKNIVGYRKAESN